MSIQLNGKTHECDGPLSVSEFLVTLDLGPQPVLVEINGEALFNREFETRQIHEGDVVEIVKMVAGG